MGSECCFEGGPSKPFDGDIKAPVVPESADRYRRFELGLPFARCKLPRFVANVQKAEAATEGEGCVSIEQLAIVFCSPAWADL